MVIFVEKIMSAANFSKISPKLLKAKVQQETELIEGYPFCAVTKSGQNSFWMVRVGSTVEGLTTGA